MNSLNYNLAPIEVTGVLFINMLLSVWWDGQLIRRISLLNELSKSNPATNMIWRDRTNLMTRYFTKGPVCVFQINQPSLCFYTTLRNKTTLLDFYKGLGLATMSNNHSGDFLPVYNPLVSVAFEVSWLWLASNWLFDSRFTYWLGLVMCVWPSQCTWEKVLFSVLRCIVFGTDQLKWGTDRALVGFE